MPIFDAGSPAYQSYTVGTVLSILWSGTAPTLGSVSPAVTCRDVTIVNTGTVPIYVGGTGLAVNGTTGLALPAGAQLTIQGFTATSNTSGNDIYGYCYGVGLASSVISGLATNAWVV